METAGSSNGSLQLRLFSKWDLFLKEIICSQRERIVSFKSSSLYFEKSLLPHEVTSLECFYFKTNYVRNESYAIKYATEERSGSVLEL